MLTETTTPAPTFDTEPVEQALLGCLLTKPALWLSCSATVRAADFYNPVHGRIFDQIGAAIAQGDTPSALTIGAVFEHDPDLTAFGGGRAYVTDLVCGMVTLASADDYARHIRDMAARRQFTALLSDAQQRTGDLSEPLAATIAALAADAVRIDDGQAGSITQTEVFEQILREMTEPRACDPTGISALDESMQGGLYRGWTYGFAAREKVGKTTLAHSISYNLNLRGIRHTYIALEMGSRQIAQRQLARRAGINSLEFLRRRDKEFQDKIARVASTMPNHASYINLPGADFETLKGVLAKEVMRRKINGFILDYWQLVGGIQKGQTEEAHLRQVAQWVADFCRRQNVWSIVIAQLNKDDNTFGGSGITKACDQLYKLHRHTDPAREEQAWLELAVTRYTPMGDVGSELQPALRLHRNVGPHFSDWLDPQTGEYL